MSSLWYSILGLIFVLYFVLGGLDQGVAMLLPVVDRRGALNALGPMFLGNEVWAVGAAGVLIAAFPRVDGELFAAAWPAIIAVVLGLAGLSAGVQLRGRGRWTGGFDALIVLSGVALALGWGLVLGVLLQGVPLAADGHVLGLAALREPLVWLTGLGNLLLVLAHGAAFLRLRAPELAMPAWTRRLGPAAGLVAALTVGGWVLQAPGGVRNPVAGVGLGLIAAVAAAGSPRLGRWAVAGTAVACALPVLAVAEALFPAVLASTLDPGATVTVDGAAAGGDTLRLLALGAAPLLPVLIAVQAACWWLFRRRTSLYW